MAKLKYFPFGRQFEMRIGTALFRDEDRLVEADENYAAEIALKRARGEARDPRAFAQLAKFARERLDLQWMDTAMLSSLHHRGLDMLAELIREPGASAPFLSPLVRSIASRRNEAELARTLELIGAAPDGTQTSVLKAYVAGRKNVRQTVGR